jgi:hypothetical protein
MGRARKDARNGHDRLQPVRIASKITAFVDNIVRYCFKTSAANRCDSSFRPRWTPPPVGLICMNVEAAVFKAENQMGLGAVVRDHSGTLK